MRGVLNIGRRKGRKSCTRGGNIPGVVIFPSDCIAGARVGWALAWFWGLIREEREFKSALINASVMKKTLEM